MAEGGREVANALQTRADEIGQAVAAKSTMISETLSSRAEEIGATS